ncbi:MAG: serine hydroxymethyltransferase, partial [Pseudomonadota bacterium]
INELNSCGSASVPMNNESSRALASNLFIEKVRPYVPEETVTQSHQFAVDARPYGGGQTASKHLRRANILACGIGLPIEGVEGDMNGLRLGSPEIVRRGMMADHMPELAHLIGRALHGAPEDVAADVSAFRQRFQGLHFIRN